MGFEGGIQNWFSLSSYTCMQEFEEHEGRVRVT